MVYLWVCVYILACVYSLYMGRTPAAIWPEVIYQHTVFHACMHVYGLRRHALLSSYTSSVFVCVCASELEEFLTALGMEEKKSAKEREQVSAQSERKICIWTPTG